MFQVENWSRSLVTLIFWADFHSLITIRKNVSNKNNIKLYWRQRELKSYFLLDLELEDNSELVDLILLKMERQHINYKTNLSIKHDRKIYSPQINIVKLEQEIHSIETNKKEKSSEFEIKYLKSLYKKVI